MSQDKKRASRSVGTEVKRQARTAQALALCLILSPLAACTGADRVTTGSTVPADMRARHPIELAQGQKNLDLLVVGRRGQIDARSTALVKEFARAYKENGQGDIAIILPSGAVGEGEARAALPAIRRALAAGGATGYTTVSTYPAADPTLASPIRLSFMQIVARTPSRCGQWPNDLASGASTQTWENNPYWNYGCSTQKNLAAQVADPRDLLGPTAESPQDSISRARGVIEVRKGNDPGTKWQIKNSDIGGLGN